MADVSTGRSGGSLVPGARVEVRERFSGGWARGFEVAELGGDGVRLRRLSDGSLLPAAFGTDELRAESGGRWA